MGHTKYDLENALKIIENIIITTSTNTIILVAISRALWRLSIMLSILSLEGVDELANYEKLNAPFQS